MPDDSIEIHPLTAPLDAAVRPPGSKSITNRALVCAALAGGPSTLSGALDSEDTRVMIDALRQLGIAIEVQQGGAVLCVSGCGGRLPATGGELYVANSGTTVRFLTALVALGQGRFRLDGTQRMRERPIGDLLDALAQLGVRAKSETGSGCPPVVLEAAGLAGGSVQIRGNVSSQFLSGLLLAAPYARKPLDIMLAGTLVSQPYIRMTLAVMRSFGVAVDGGDLSHLRVPAPAAYRGCGYPIEPDASAASYFWAAAAIAGGRVTVQGLTRDSLQGDVAFCDCLKQMGCRVESDGQGTTVTGTGALRAIDVDMNAISDTVQTLAAVALFAEGTTRIRNVAHIRHKETDRIRDLAREVRRFGAVVEEHHDGLAITPPHEHGGREHDPALRAAGPSTTGLPASNLHGAEIHTYNDHRMAMSMALVGLRVPGVVIRDPGCTAKTYPLFFRDLAALAR